MMYQHSVNSGVGCSGSSPTTSTPPNINNACSSTTPPLASNNQQNPSQNDGNNGNNEHMVSELSNQTSYMETKYIDPFSCFGIQKINIDKPRHKPSCIELPIVIQR